MPDWTVLVSATDVYVFREMRHQSPTNLTLVSEEGTVSRRDKQTPNSDESEKTLPTAELHPKNRKGPGSSLERDRYQW